MTNSLISKKASLGKNVQVGPNTIIHDNVIIADNVTIESNCIIGSPTKHAKGKPLIIGKDSYIRSHSVFYEGSSFDDRLITGHHLLIRENINAGKNLQIGSYTELEGDTDIGNFVRLHSKVQLSKETTVGDFVWIFPRVQTSTDPLPPSKIEEPITIGDMAVIAIGSLILPGSNIGIGSFVAAGSVVRGVVPDVHCVSGSPAKVFAKLDKLINFKHRLSYPWPKHNKGSYPEDSYPLMDSYVKKINTLLKKV
jgi:acetyltransferase-like isoleucine patch superfamily enzyme